MGDAHDRQPSVLVAVGNPERERQLLAALRDGGFTIAGRHLDGATLVERILAESVDLVLVARDLHRLSLDLLIAVAETRTPTVLLVGAADEERYDEVGYTVPADCDGPTVVAALRRALRAGVEPRAQRPPAVPEESRRSEGNCEIVALISGKGAPGTSTVAIGLAAALGAAGKRVLLIDGDLRGGSLGPYLDLDPRKGLAGLTLGRTDSASVAGELQPGPGFAVLAGIERPEVVERLAPEHLTRALDALQPRFDAVLIDVGETLPGVTSLASATLIRSAERVLLVATADLFGLVNARTSLRYLTEALGVPPAAVTVLVNRYDSGGAYGIDEIERVLDVAVAGLLPDDRTAARRALSDQVPVTAVGGKLADTLSQLASQRARPRQTNDQTAAISRSRRRWRRQSAEGRQ
ncbi:MAG: P-loop NTPase [Dehalococcoidia bacterium]|nr:P-loop NTPase [Dehalococcoidia bacterium]